MARIRTRTQAGAEVSGDIPLLSALDMGYRYFKSWGVIIVGYKHGGRVIIPRYKHGAGYQPRYKHGLPHYHPTRQT